MLRGPNSTLRTLKYPVYTWKLKDPNKFLRSLQELQGATKEFQGIIKIKNPKKQ